MLNGVLGEHVVEVGHEPGLHVLDLVRLDDRNVAEALVGPSPTTWRKRSSARTTAGS